jgi:MFS family permease
MLILFRIIQGLGNAMVFATGIAILISVFPPQKRGKVLGINIAATYIGLSSGPILGGVLTELFTWRSVFWINVPLGLIIIVLVISRLKGDWAEAQGDKFDFTGACFYGASILGLMYGISLLPGLKGVGLTCLGIIFIGLFLYRESRIAFPVFDLNLFRTNKVFAFSNLAALINYSATFAIAFWLSLYFQNLKAYTPAQTGLILLSQPLIMAIFSPLAGLLSDRKEPRLLATLGMIITTLGLLLFAFLKMDTPPAFVVANLILIGFGFALFSSPNTNAVMSCIEKRQYGIASGSLGTMRLLGMTISMGISTMILSVYLGSVQITPEYFATFVKGIRAAFMIFSLLCFGGIFASGIRGKMHNGADEAPLTDAPRS